jgi:membrane associated rhomboid family serine protease
VFVPIHDDNPLRRIQRPFVTWGIIAVTCLAYVASATGSGERALASFAIIPRELFGMGLWGGAAPGGRGLIQVPERYTLVTYMFMHGDVFHLIGNMAFLWVFGDNIEDALGHWRFAAFYLLCGIAGGFAHALMNPASPVALIGASGAVAGIVVAYLILYPRVRVWVLLLRVIPLRITAAFALGLWVLSQFAMGLLPYIWPSAEIDPVSWWAHIGGIIAGGILVLVLRQEKTPL